MQSYQSGNLGRPRDRWEGKAWIAAVIAVVALVSFAAIACSSEEAEHPSGSSATMTSASPSDPAAAFPTAAFADISEDPVSEDTAAEFQAALDDMAGRAGMAATVMSPDGTWSGATGKADGERDVRVDDQFAIASVTKSIVAAQVMKMVEAGELDFDDPATDHLPADLDFDTNGATIRQLLGQHSGIPQNDFDAEDKRLLAHPRRFWAPAEVFAEFVPPERAPAGEAYEYANANYQLLGLVIEEIRGRPLADVLRDGVLNVEGTDRLIYQPDEKPTAPMAMPGGQSSAALKKGGGYLPFLAAVTADGAAAAMASDAPSLARWWRAFCAGEIVSQASLNEMTTLHDGYGLGLYDVADPYAHAVGHTGGGIPATPYVSWAGCLPEYGSVVVVLTNRLFDDIGGMALPLVEAASRA
jgi:D-alanyl-D-alanine carboxypeptidase